MYPLCDPRALPNVCRRPFWSQIGRVVYGASDAKRGFKEHGGELHPKTEIISGIMEEECGDIMTQFFQRKRK